jgi:hypothetical protein
MYADHPVFRTPPESTVIWRYTSWGRLCDLVTSNALFFARATKFADPWEASYPEHQYGPDERWGDVMQFATDETKDDYRRQELEIRESFAQSRRTCAVSCWHMADGESDTHWRIYGHSTEGVAIRSTVGHLKRAIDIYKERTIHIGEVNYVDYATARVPTNNGFWPIVHKRLAFQHDREVRAVAWEQEPGPSWNEDGVRVPVDVDLLIQEAVVSPLAGKSFAETVAKVLRKLGISTSVRRSTLLDPPSYRLP